MLVIHAVPGLREKSTGRKSVRNSTKLTRNLRHFHNLLQVDTSCNSLNTICKFQYVLLSN